VNVNELPNLEPSDDLRLMTVDEAANFLAMSRGSVYNLMRSGALNSVQIGRARRIPFAEVHRLVRTAYTGS
jgi:excisionase family DNA binding protein